jgi:hypothetical protein
MNKQKIYLSGGFYSNWQKIIIDSLKNKFIFYNPRVHEIKNFSEYYVWDTLYVRQCDILFAYMEKENPSGYGLSYEIGLAKALNKIIILVDDRSKTDVIFEKYFRIIRASADIIFDNIEDAIIFLKKMGYN